MNIVVKTVSETLTFEAEEDLDFLNKYEKCVRKNWSFRIATENESYSVNPRNIIYIKIDNIEG